MCEVIICLEVCVEQSVIFSIIFYVFQYTQVYTCSFELIQFKWSLLFEVMVRTNK